MMRRLANIKPTLAKRVLYSDEDVTAFKRAYYGMITENIYTLIIILYHINRDE